MGPPWLKSLEANELVDDHLELLAVLPDHQGEDDRRDEDGLRRMVQRGRRFLDPDWTSLRTLPQDTGNSKRRTAALGELGCRRGAV